MQAGRWWARHSNVTLLTAKYFISSLANKLPLLLFLPKSSLPLFQDHYIRVQSRRENSNREILILQFKPSLGGRTLRFCFAATHWTPFTPVTCVCPWKEYVVSSGSFLGHAHVTLALIQLDRVCGVLASEVTFSVGVTCPKLSTAQLSQFWSLGPRLVEVKTQMKSKSELTNSHETA